MEDPTQRRDREIVEAETEAERDALFDLAETCSNDRAMRREAIDALRGVISDHEPPPAPDWARRLLDAG